MLTLEDVAERMGVCYRTAFNWHKKKLLKTFKVGKVVRIRPEDLQAFIEGNVSKPVENVYSEPDERQASLLKPAPKSRRRTKKAGVGPGLAFLRKFDAGRK